jgi:hypothetical protein
MASNGKQTFELTLILSDIGELYDELTDSVYEASFTDALVGVTGGVPFVDVAQEGTSFPETVIDVLQKFERHVTSRYPSIRVVRVAVPDEAFLHTLNDYLALQAKFPLELRPVENPYEYLLETRRRREKSSV